MDNKIFYSQKVLGQYQIPFQKIKIRTMIKGADSQFEQLALTKTITGNGKIKNDPRITPLGKYLRLLHIDEMPQIYNIFLNQMTLVGIRPRTQHDWKLMGYEHKKTALRHKPGLFGVNYYYENLRDLQDLINCEIEYLKEKEKKPIQTDIKYFKGIITNRTKQINQGLQKIILKKNYELIM
ncbi:sugar transferase [Candidatus Woesearchaeota archaeon]|nr:sugar transferase [Candidatus Woesearchaeota archaeon]